MTGDNLRHRSTRPLQAPVRTFIALSLAGLVLTGASCARSSTQSLDDLARIIGRSASETKVIVGGNSATAESTAARWLARIETYRDSDLRASCDLALSLSGYGTPKSDDDLRKLLQLTSAITDPSQEVTDLRDSVATRLVKGTESITLVVAIVAFDQAVC